MIRLYAGALLLLTLPSVVYNTNNAGSISVKSNSPISTYELAIVTISIRAINSSVTVEVCFDPESSIRYTLTASMNETFSLQAEHVYSEPGRYNVTVRMVAVEDAPVARTEVIVRQAEPFISGAGHTKEQPRYMYPWQRVTLRGIVPIHTQGVTQVQFKWTAHFMPAGRRTMKELPLRLFTRTNETNIILPEFSMSYGIYLIKFEVVKYTASGIIKASDAKWIKVIRSHLQPVTEGGSSRTINFMTASKVDGSLSFDPDLPPTKAASQVSYAWCCIRGVDVRKLPTDYHNRQSSTDHSAGCFHRHGICLPHNDSKIDIDKSVLKGARVSGQYTFRLFVSKPGRRTVYMDQLIEIVSPRTADIKLLCHVNCQQYINPSEKLVLQLLCSSCQYGEALNYMWTLSVMHPGHKQVLAWKQDTAVYRPSLFIVIKPEMLTRSGGHYHLSVYVKRVSAPSAFARYNFKSSSLSAIGHHCALEPKTGTALQTRFSVHCSGAVREHHPLSYTVYAMTDDNFGVGNVLYEGYEHVMPNLLLPMGDRHDNFKLKVIVYAKDIFGATVEYLLTAKVLAYPMNHMPKLFKLTVGSRAYLSELITYAKREEAISFVQSFSSVLNGYSPDATSAEQKQTELQTHELLLHTLASLDSPRDLRILQQLGAALYELTRKTSGLTESCIRRALTIANQLSTEVLQYSIKGATYSEVKLASHALLRVASNIVDVSIKVMNDSSVNKTKNKKVLTVKNKVDTIIDNIKEALHVHIVQGEDPTILNAKNVVLQMLKSSSHEMMHKTFHVGYSELKDKPSVVLASLLSNRNQFDEVAFEATYFTKASYPRPDTSLMEQTDVLQLTLSHRHQRIKRSSDPFDLFLPHKGMSSGKTASLIITGDQTSVVEVVLNDSDHDIHVIMDAQQVGTPKSGNVPFISLRVFHQHLLTDLVDVLVPISDRQPSARRVLWYTKIKRSDVLVADVLTVHLRAGQPQNYINATIAFVQATCQLWHESDKTWKTDHCSIGPKLDFSHVHCVCTDLASFTSSYDIIPSTISRIPDAARRRLRRRTTTVTDNYNITGVVTISCISVLYVLILVVAWRRDMIYKRKERPVDLADNRPEDNYVYLLTVYTGHTLKSGTTSSVSVELQGEHASSEPRVLHTNFFSVLQRSEINIFIIRTSHCLGKLSFLHFSSNFAGCSPSWYLNHAVVLDVKENKEYYFICKDWLKEKKEYSTSKTFRACTHLSPENCRYLSMYHASSGFIDYHLWISALFRQPHSKFTCIQRVSCIYSLLVAYMLLNTIFCRLYPEQNIGSGTVDEILVEVRHGFQSALLMFPFSLLLDVIFRYSDTEPIHKRRHQKGISPPGRPDVNQNKTSFSSDFQSSSVTMLSADDSVTGGKFDPCTTQPAANTGCFLFPWWTVMIAWIFIVVVNVIFIVCTSLFTQSYSEQLAYNWLTTCVFSLLSDIIIIENIKVAIMAFYIHALFHKRINLATEFGHAQ